MTLTNTSHGSNEVSRMLEITYSGRRLSSYFIHGICATAGLTNARLCRQPAATQVVLRSRRFVGFLSRPLPGKPGQDVDHRFRNLACRGPLSQIGPELGFDSAE